MHRTLTYVFGVPVLQRLEGDADALPPVVERRPAAVAACGAAAPECVRSQQKHCCHTLDAARLPCEAAELFSGSQVHKVKYASRANAGAVEASRMVT